MLVAGWWLLVAGRWLLIAGPRLLVTRRRLLVAISRGRLIRVLGRSLRLLRRLSSAQFASGQPKGEKKGRGPHKAQGSGRHRLSIATQVVRGGALARSAHPILQATA